MIKAPLIDPNNVENFQRDVIEKEAFFLFTVLVAGKNAKTIAPKSQKFHQDLINLLLSRVGEYDIKEKGVLQLLNYISSNEINHILRLNKIGKYNVLNKMFNQLKKEVLDLNNVTINRLEELSGVGKKTSRYFLLYSHKNIKDIAILDRHVLTFLKNKGYNVPQSTPSGKKYDYIEKIFLKEFFKSGYKNITDFDLDIWKSKGNL